MTDEPRDPCGPCRGTGWADGVARSSGVPGAAMSDFNEAEFDARMTAEDSRYPARKAASEALHKHISQWIEEYEFDDGESGCHTPSEFERVLIYDAFAGLTGDDEYLRLRAAWRSLCGPAHVAGSIDANALERMAKERPDECFLKGSGVLKLIGGIRQLEAELRALKRTNGLGLPHRTHTTDAGESLEGIALRQLKDESRWVEIRDLNADRFPGMAAHDYYPVGTVLNLPAGVPGTEVVKHG